VPIKKDEIQKKYWDKQVLFTNVEMTPDFNQMDGGIVRYYATNSMEDLFYKCKQFVKLLFFA
jgi:hypothetical protein